MSVNRILPFHAVGKNQRPRTRHGSCSFPWIWLLLLFFIVTKPTPAQSNQQVPQPDSEPLSIEELRWCKNEVFRLSGEAKEVDQSEYWEIHDYNQNVTRYRNLCLNRTSLADAAQRISNELTPTAKQGVRDAGVRRFAFSRLNRNENRIYVTSERAKVFQSNRPDAPQVAELRQWEEAFLLGRTQSNRVEIEWLIGIPQIRNTGWIVKSDYSPGNGKQAREAYCRANQGAPVQANELVLGNLSRDRFMLLQVHNLAPQDAYVKLLQTDRNVIVSFLVAAHSNRTINGLPQGEYEIAYATGFEFSRGCGSFVKRGFTGRVSQPIIFDDHSYEWAISIKTPTGVTTARDTRAYSEFESL